MRDFMVLMHNDKASAPSADMWAAYFSSLRRRGVFDGGSAIGVGDSFRKQSEPGRASGHISGYIRVRAERLAEAAQLLVGNPVFECGGTVKIRELPRG